MLFPKPPIEPFALQIGGAIALSAFLYRFFEAPAPACAKKPRRRWRDYFLAEGRRGDAQNR